VYGEVVRGHLGAVDASQIFPRFAPDGHLGLFGGSK
jgi:hypothetical protein